MRAPDHKIVFLVHQHIGRQRVTTHNTYRTKTEQAFHTNEYINCMNLQLSLPVDLDRDAAILRRNSHEYHFAEKEHANTKNEIETVDTQNGKSTFCD